MRSNLTHKHREAHQGGQTPVRLLAAPIAPREPQWMIPVTRTRRPCRVDELIMPPLLHIVHDGLLVGRNVVDKQSVAGRALSHDVVNPLPDGARHIFHEERNDSLHVRVFNGAFRFAGQTLGFTLAACCYAVPLNQVSGTEDTNAKHTHVPWLRAEDSVALTTSDRTRNDIHAGDRPADAYAGP
jgi:hypothetical protein